MQSLFHFSHIAAIIVAIGYGAWRVRSSLTKPEAHYLVEWLAACGLWIVYYSLKGTGFLQVAELSEDLSALETARYGLEFYLNGLNTVAIFLTAQALHRKRIPFRQKVHYAAYTAAIFTIIFICSCVPVFLGFSFSKWVFGSTIGASFFSGFVLIFLYHRTSQSPGLSLLQSAGLLYLFFGYSFLQSWYPYVTYFRDFGPVFEFFIYGVALIFKVLCTLVLFEILPKRVERDSAAGALLQPLPETAA